MPLFFIRLIRLIRGYVNFDATGGFPERFINLCSANGIPLWDVKCVKGVLNANTTFSDYGTIFKVAEKAGMTPTIKAQYGMPFILNKYKKRLGIIVGIIITVFIISILSSMILSISISGNKKLTEQEILLVLNEMGLKIGSRKNKLNIYKMQVDALCLIDELSWISINIEGSTAIVEIRERVSPPKIIDNKRPCNIIASNSGEITKMEVYEGEAATKVGCAVVKGDLLIGGIITLKNGGSVFLHAKGLVMAKTERQVKTVIKIEQNVKIVRGKKIRFSLSLFGFNLPLGIKTKSDEYYKIEKMLKTGGVKLPIGIIRERYSEHMPFEISLTTAQGRLIALIKHRKAEKSMLEKSKILKGNFQITTSKNLCTINAKYLLEENIGMDQYFKVEE